MLRLQPQTLRTRLVTWFLIPSLVVWALGSWWVYETSLRTSSYSYDYTLIATLDVLARRIRTENGKIVVDFPTQIIPILRERHIDKRFYQIAGPDRRIIEGDPLLPQLANYPEETELTTGSYNDSPIRIAARKVRISREPGQFCYVQIAETLGGRLFVAQETADRLLLGGALMYLMILIFTGIAVKRGLLPLASVQEELSHLTLEGSHTLNEQSAPEEIRPLIAAINDLVSRVRSEFQRQKRFISNAAHQLRTPLAGLKVQTALALRDPNLKSISPALGQIEKSLDKATHLINKMLTLASSEPGVIQEKQTSQIDLNEVVRSVVKDLAQRAITKEIDLGIETPASPVYLVGIEWSIKELTNNLIENALIYTPERGTVTVRTESKPRAALLIVEDSGPGIPPEERVKIFERFYRLPNAPKGGSGLGLAIVKEVASAHKATIEITDGAQGKGTKFIIEFPHIERPSTVIRI